MRLLVLPEGDALHDGRPLQLQGKVLPKQHGRAFRTTGAGTNLTGSEHTAEYNAGPAQIGLPEG